MCFSQNLKSQEKFGAENKNTFHQLNLQPVRNQNQYLADREKELNKNRRSLSLEIILENPQINSRPNYERK